MSFAAQGIHPTPTGVTALTAHSSVSTASSGVQVPFLSPLKTPREFTTQELQLSGACDWYKISRLVESETKLIKMLNKVGLVEQAHKLEDMRDDVLAHRMANSPFQSAKMFLRNNCANDAYIAKWRHDIDAFVKSLRKTVDKQQIARHRAIDIVYESQLLRQQARVSLPYTGFYNPVPKIPAIPPKTFKDPQPETRFTVTPLADLGLRPVQITTHVAPVITASFPSSLLYLTRNNKAYDFL